MCEQPDGIYEGPYRSFGIDGRLRERGEYHHRQRDGLWRSWTATGVIATEVTWRGGVSELARAYFADGTLAEVTHFANGKKDGAWTVYYPTGAVAVEGNFRAGEAEGAWRWFALNGSVQRTATFHDGVEARE